VKLKAGDKVWVLCEVKQALPDGFQVKGCSGGIPFWVLADYCRPVESAQDDHSVEPPPKQPTRAQKLAEQALKGIWAANDSANGTPVIKQSLTPEPNPSEILDSSSDPINPSHYKQGGIECIEAIKAATGDGFPDYLRGNVMKYLWRWPKKGGVDDLKKARWYLDRLISEAGE
jgi:hypothetical protein